MAAGTYVAIGAAIIGAGAAIWGGEQQRHAASMQNEYLNQQTLANRNALNYNLELGRLQTQNNYEENTFSMLTTENNEARYRSQLQLLGITAELAGQRHALEHEITDWQLATIDWEKGFKDQQAQLIGEQGVLQRDLFGRETVKLLAKERSRMASAGVEIGSGSPLASLGALADDRQYQSDIMKFGTDVDIWGKNVEGAQLLNQKNQVRFNSALSDISYAGTVAENQYNV
jgi:hypothetical protein